jgi:hypothetical protein
VYLKLKFLIYINLSLIYNFNLLPLNLNYFDLLKPEKNINTNSTTNSTPKEVNIKKISVHVPTHLKPKNDTEFGHYLAGLIDGDGYIHLRYITISFNFLDASLAYYIKSKIGYGNVYKIKNKKAISLVISKKEGIYKILSLINGKLRSENKLNQVNRFLSNSTHNLIKNKLNFKLNELQDLNNY